MGRIIIKKSKIHGKGVFANRDFKKNEIVIKWKTQNLLSKEEVEKLPKKEKMCVVYVNREYILMQAPARYANHSCDANTYVNNFCDVAKRDITKGEEITANYSETMAPGEYMKCNCGSKNCKGIIKATE